MAEPRKTPEELQAEIDAQIAEAEQEDTPQVEDQAPEQQEPAEEAEKEEEPDEVEEEVEEDTEEEPQKDDVDYKKKFSESSREAQKIAAKNRKITQAIDEANEIPEPTEEELQDEYSDWDVMSQTERKLAKEAFISKQWRTKISQAREESKKIEKWNEDVDSFVDNPQTFIDYPDLEGKQDEFKQFATAESNNSVPFKILVAAFLHEQGTKQVKHTGSQMPTGQGGAKEKMQKKSDKISNEEAENLRVNNYSKYKELLRAGKIDITNI